MSEYYICPRRMDGYGKICSSIVDCPHLVCNLMCVNDISYKKCMKSTRKWKYARKTSIKQLSEEEVK